MFNTVDRYTWFWAALATLGGIAFFLVLEVLDEPVVTARGLISEFLETLPIVVSAVGLALLAVSHRRHREDTRELIRELEVARAQGQRWRSDARGALDSLGAAIDAQFSKWELSDAEREVALLLLKGLSLKEIAGLRATAERTVRTQARMVYSKGGLTGRAALSAFFLEDLLAPIEGVK